MNTHVRRKETEAGYYSFRCVVLHSGPLRKDLEPNADDRGTMSGTAPRTWWSKSFPNPPLPGVSENFRETLTGRSAVHSIAGDELVAVDFPREGTRHNERHPDHLAVNDLREEECDGKPIWFHPETRRKRHHPAEDERRQ